MRIKVKTTIAGPGVNAGPGDVITVPDAFGRDLVAGGYAEVVAADPRARVETATAPEPAERTVTRKGAKG